jgi:hypothetical protein
LDEECSQFLVKGSSGWDPKQSNVDDLNNVRCEASRHFRNKEEGVSES